MQDRATRPWCRLGCFALVAVGALIVGWPLVVGPVGLSSPAAAATGPQDVGTPTIWDPTGTNNISSGGSATPFKLGDPTAAGVLPGGTGAGGACPGDTSTGGYNVWTFLTYDNATNGGAPAKLTLEQTGGSFAADHAAYASEPPVPALPLADPQGSTWGGPSNPEATAIQTGVVTNLPTFAFSPLLTGDFINGTPAQANAGGLDLFPGKWDLGVVCTGPGDPTPTNYWNVQFMITASSSDPNGFTWSLAPQSPPPSTTTTTSGAGTTTTSAPSGSSSTTSVGSTSSTLGSGGTTTTVVASGAGETGSTGSGAAGATGGAGSVPGGTGSGDAASSGTTDPGLAATGSPTGREALIGALILLIGARLLLVAGRLPLRAPSASGDRRPEH